MYCVLCFVGLRFLIRSNDACVFCGVTVFEFALHACVNTHTHTHTHTHMCLLHRGGHYREGARTRSYTYTYTYTYTNPRTHTRTHMRACAHTSTRPHVHKTEEAAIEKELEDAEVLRPFFTRTVGQISALTGADDDESYMEYDT